MVKQLYKLELRGSVQPGDFSGDAIDNYEATQERKYEATVLVNGKDTHLLFTTAYNLYQLNGWTYNDVYEVVHRLTESMGYKQECRNIADTVCDWTERMLDDYDAEDFQHWLNS